MIKLAYNLLTIFQILLIGYFILSWFPLQSGGFMHQIWTLLDRLFQPILKKLRGVLPRVGMFDLSGMVLIIGIIILQGILINYI